MAEGRSRPAWAEVDLAAIRHNVALLRRLSAPADLCAVVKAAAYGHGAVAVATAAVDAGAACLAVAMVDEGVELRDAGITQPILLLSEPPEGSEATVVSAGLIPTVASEQVVARLAAAARGAARSAGRGAAAGAVKGAARPPAAGGTFPLSRRGPLPVHLKVDTGMHRVGADPGDVPALVKAVQAEPELRLGGLWTHLAVADGTDDDDRAFTSVQLDRFDAAVTAATAATGDPAATGDGPPRPVLHAANSAAAIAWPRARYDLVRCGIAVYGELPAPALAGTLADVAGGDTLRPALSLKARVTAVRQLDAGERPSYGRRRPLPGRSVVATVPLGYADGLPRALFDAGFSVLVGGRRRPLAGMVTMDQIVVDCGPDATVAVGDEVVLLGRQGDQAVTTAEWASLLGTIGYEVLCGIGPRVPRTYVDRARDRAPDGSDSDGGPMKVAR
ncbi:MAG TPA: alanine racemase [Acidimicrobiales bacterium]|nr:alanine racemase [Acidimicrobiales bacterium]